MRSENLSIGQEKRSFIEEARRAQIVASAIDALAELGYGKASLAEIAKRAGISKGVISYHFDGKDELMEQIVTDVYTKGANYVLPKVLAEESAAGMLRALIESNIDFIASNAKDIAATMEVILNFRNPDGTIHFDTAADEPNVKGVEDLLKEGQKSGEFRDFDTHVMAVSIRAAIDRASSQFRAEPDLDPASYAREMADIFEYATRKQSGERDGR